MGQTPQQDLRAQVVIPPARVTPWPYQIQAAEIFHKEGLCRMIFADEMGLGKTGEAFKAWEMDDYRGPAILLGRVNALSAFYRQAPLWGCPRPLIVRGSAGVRARLWNSLAQRVKMYGGKTNRRPEMFRGLFYATSREAFKIDLRSRIVDPEWFRFVFIDEAHRDANRKTQNYSAAKQLCGRTANTHVALLTGSPMKKGGQNLWGLLNIARPWTYRSYWQFIEKYFILDKDGAFGWEILGLRHATQMQVDLAKDGVFLMRTKKEVKPQMPPKIRSLDENVIEMLPDQAKLYDQVREHGLAELENGNMIITPNVLSTIVRLRQILLCPKIFDSSLSYGGAIERLVEMLEENDDHHMAIFTPFTAAIPFIEERLLTFGIPAEKIVIFKGGLTPEELAERQEYFQQVRGLAIVSIAFAESFDLTPAEWAVFLGFDWDAYANIQAEDRLHRGDLKTAVNIYYIRYEQGIDSSLMLDALDTKIANVMAILHNVEAVRQALNLKARTP